MTAPMGRRRKHDLELPQHMYARGGRYYFGRNHIALGADLRQALTRYAELVTGVAGPGTFADAAGVYTREELATKSRKTQEEYKRQLATLVLAFGDMRLDQIAPKHVADYMRARGRKFEDDDGKQRGGKIAATREKALLSAVFNVARAAGLTSAPNPCAGIKDTKAKRDRYVLDAELALAITQAQAAGDEVLARFLELCYLTGQRPSDVARVRRGDVRDGLLWVTQGKTQAKVRIAVVGPLEPLLARLMATDGVASMYLVRDERGQPLTLGALRNRFKKLGGDWQIRDLRAKAASDSDTAKAAQALLGHSAASTTDGYIRQRAGNVATPIMRKVKE